MNARNARRLARYLPGDRPERLSVARVFLFTDLHLDVERPAECAQFCASLHALLPRASGAAVIVMGDLFDAYAGPEDWALEPFSQIREGLSALALAGAQVRILRGNRDVLLEPAHLLAESGIGIRDSVVVSQESGAATLITHGDSFCLADRRYQFLRRTLRRPAMRRFLLARSVGVRRWLANRLRGVSRGEVARKPLEHLDVVPEALCDELASQGCQTAVIGHLHQERRLDFGENRRLQILPAWIPGSRAWELAALLDAGL